MKKKIIFIVGPTAVGKSKLAIRLARKIGGEIISCDSMQVYQGLDILSSKPSPKEMQHVKHHLIGIIPANRSFDVNQFIKKSKELIEGIHNNNKIPIFVGGTGLYIDSLLNGIFEGPVKNSRIRNELYRKAKIQGSQYLYKKLKKVDPTAARKIHPNDLRRIIRALEVYQITKTPISKLQKKRKGIFQDKRFKIHIFGLNIKRKNLYNNINNRVDEMFKQGIVEEVKRSLKKRYSKTFKQALGIKEVASYLKGKISLDEAKYLLKRNTRHFAKRQMSWFRKNKRISWLRKGGVNLSQILQKL